MSKITTKDARMKYRMDPDSGVQWEFIGSFLSGVDSEQYPFDTDVVAAIRRELDPGFVPLVRKTVYRSGAGTDRVWEHHAWFRILPELDSSIGIRRITKPILWPSAPGSVNYGIGKYQDRLVFVSNIGFVGDSERMPGRFRPIGWHAFKDIKSGYEYTRAVEAAEHAKRLLEFNEGQAAKNKAEADDLISYAYDSNQRRFDGNPLVSVPASFGDAA
jgi:hypothetical protein